MLKQQETKRSPDSRDRSDAESNLYRYRLDIDGLRGISVIAVLVFHASKSLMPSGLRGVDVFFVISGYVVTASVLRHQSKTLSSSNSKFQTADILQECRQEVFLSDLADFFFSSSMNSMSAVQRSNQRYLVSAKRS